MPFIVNEQGAFTVYRNPESPELWPLVAAFRYGDAKGEILSNWNPKSHVHLIEWQGARYVVKRVLRGSPPLEKILQERIHGPFYSRLMRDVLAARKNGCTVLQNMHLVAERVENGVCLETYLVLEYVEGTALTGRQECRKYGGQIASAMLELHSRGLALGDVNHKNFLLCKDKAGNERIVIIDLSARGFFRLGKIKDIVRMRMRYGIALPVRGIVDKILFAFVFIQQQFFYRIRLFRNTKTNPLRPADE